MPNALKGKSFWSKPEGIVGIVFLLAIILGGAFLVSSLWPNASVKRTDA